MVLDLMINFIVIIFKIKMKNNLFYHNKREYLKIFRIKIY
jgi:hypothetical protein